MGTEYTALVVVDDEATLERYERWLAPEYEVVVAAESTASCGNFDDADVVLRNRPFPRVSPWPVGTSIGRCDEECTVLIATGFDPNESVVHCTSRESLSGPVGEEHLRDSIARLFARARYDDLLADYADLAARRGAIVTERSADDLETDREFAELSRRIDDVHAELETITAAFEAADFDAAFETPDFCGGPRILHAAWTS